MFFKRSLLVLLVAAALAAVLSGCAGYELRQPMADRGTVTLTWQIGTPPCGGCGCAQEIAKGHWLVTLRREYTFNDLCASHELLHVFGARHEVRK